MPDPVTGIMAGSAIFGGASNIMGANKAAGAVKDASMQANAMTQQRWQDIIGMFKEMYGKGEAALKPYTDLGGQAAGQLSSQMGDLTAPIMMDQETLEKTPGYEFLIKQGQRGVTGANVLRGLSGAQIKGSEDFIKGLADTTYKTQFDIANTNKTNAFNRLFQTTQAGQTAGTSLLNAGVGGAVGLAGPGMTGAGIQSGTTMAAGNAQAGADIATGQQVGSMISGLPYTPYVANKLYPNGMPGSAPAVTGMYGAGGSADQGPYDYRR